MLDLPGAGLGDPLPGAENMEELAVLRHILLRPNISPH
jgi:hypothetical protein